MIDDVAAFAGGVAAGALLTAAGSRWVFRVLTRRIRAAERRSRDAERATEIAAMTRGLAHEIKNPLSTIGLNAQLLAEGIDESGLDDETRGRLSRRVGSLRREAERLRGILTDFLEFAGEIRLHATPANLNQIVDELVDFFLPQAEQNGVRLRADLSSTPLVASLDVQLVKQAILNLMLNAVQAMSPGSTAGGGRRDGAGSRVGPPHADGSSEPDGAGRGSPRSSGRTGDGTAEGAAFSPPAARELILRTQSGQQPDGTPTVIVHVIDTGPGIAPESRGKIFEPYFTTKSGGTGLGLPTTRRLVEAHGGRIELFTEPGKGSDFMLVFPVSGVVPPTGADAEPREVGGEFKAARPG